MLSLDEALTIGLGKYREAYPQGAMPTGLEDVAVLSQIPGDRTATVVVSFNIRGAHDPFVLFQAVVDREAGVASVVTARDWRELEGRELDESKSLR